MGHPRPPDLLTSSAVTNRIQNSSSLSLTILVSWHSDASRLQTTDLTNSGRLEAPARVFTHLVLLKRLRSDTGLCSRDAMTFHGGFTCATARLTAAACVRVLVTDNMTELLSLLPRMTAWSKLFSSSGPRGQILQMLSLPNLQNIQVWTHFERSHENSCRAATEMHSM